jgi:hypothetical protein
MDRVAGHRVRFPACGAGSVGMDHDRPEGLDARYREPADAPTGGRRVLPPDTSTPGYIGLRSDVSGIRE